MVQNAIAEWRMAMAAVESEPDPVVRHQQVGGAEGAHALRCLRHVASCFIFCGKLAHALANVMLCLMLHNLRYACTR